MCALDVLHLWDAPDVVVEYLNTGDESIREAAYSAAYSAACSATNSAARSAACSAANYAAYSAAYSAAYYAARSAAKKKQKAKLIRMVDEAFRKEDPENIDPYGPQNHPLTPYKGDSNDY
ncbi:MAG: hypothetical protein COA78_20495 [Blastopirellula sp.]|nr:MAG: hypothetical protein COA78_20495 [Blastopirellula sp.]